MAQSPVHVTVEYSSPGAQPPVYVTGSFSGWQPQEMQYTTDANNEHVFHKELEVEPGKEYHYKFRLGPGDWWVLNEDAPTSTDSMGNRNNVLSAPIQPPKANEPETNPTIPSETTTTTSEHAELATSSLETKPVEEAQPEEAAQTTSRDSKALDPADTAAEVADSAAAVDKEESEPAVSDAEAGPAGLRRLSNTPIPEVAKTAAEVADVAAVIDKNHMKYNMPPTPTEAEITNGNTDSGSSTPWEDRAPLFAHECMGADDALYPQARYQTEPLTPLTSNDEAIAKEEIDFNDPTLEQFPHDHRQSILERVKTVKSRLDEDETHFEGTPHSPLVSPPSSMNGASRSPERREISSISPTLLATEQHKSPSLSSIAEEHSEIQGGELLPLPSAAGLENKHREPELMHLNHEEEAPPSKDVSEASVDIQEVAESPIHPAEPAPDSSSPPEQTSNGSHKEPEAVLPTTVNGGLGEGDDCTREVGTGDEGPSIMVSPATPSSEPASKEPVDEAKSTAVETENGRSDSKLTPRKQPPQNDRSITPTSLSSEHASKSQNYLKAFWRVVFVDWLGGLITRLCGGRRHTLLAISALLIIGIGPALYLRA